MTLSLAIIIELLCFAVALITLVKVKDKAWRGMIIYLFITCVAEITGHILKKAHHHNQWVYNIALIAEAAFNSAMFGSILKQYIKSRPLIISGLALFFAAYIFGLIKDGVYVFNDLALNVMSVIFVMYSFCYYYLVIKDENYTNLRRSASFWWVTGSLFYYFGGTASNLFYGFLNNIKFGGVYISYITTVSLCALLYGCWIYSFICKRWQQTNLEV